MTAEKSSAAKQTKQTPSLSFVMALLLIAAIVAWVLWPRIGRGPGTRTIFARTEIEKLSTALEAYRVDTGNYPPGTNGLEALIRQPAAVTNWRGPYLDRLLLDPWGHAYLYACPGVKNPSAYDLSSAGPNGNPGDADEIVK